MYSSSSSGHQVMTRSTTDQAQQWMWMKRHRTTHFLAAAATATWEERAFAEDASSVLNGGGCIWPPRSYPCSFCRREFRSAQALGGHMNVHRRDRARLKQQQCHDEEEEQEDHVHHPVTAAATTTNSSSPRVSSSSITTASNNINNECGWLDLGLMVNVVESSSGGDELSGHCCNDVEAILAGGKRRKTTAAVTTLSLSIGAASEGMGMCTDLDLELRL
ncbi:unnamed protein product [Linum trigynum]|uniref:C2H2-type domain-containing protein n=1 Tax=Linum trigynum TaxID=586398 RepID=A0AAV2DMT0_9ROSI